MFGSCFVETPVLAGGPSSGLGSLPVLRTGTLVRLAIRARPELAKVPCPPYMDAPVLPSTHFMLDSGSRLHPYIRT